MSCDSTLEQSFCDTQVISSDFIGIFVHVNLQIIRAYDFNDLVDTVINATYAIVTLDNLVTSHRYKFVEDPQEGFRIIISREMPLYLLNVQQLIWNALHFYKR